MSWRDIILGDAIHVKHGFAFKSQHFSDNGEYIVLTPGNFNEEGGFRLRPGKNRFYAGDIPDEYILSKDDLVIAMTEQGSGLLGSSALIPDGDKFLHNQRIGLIQDLNETVLDKKFLYYLFNTRSIRGQISGSATGTKVKHTAPERIYRVNATVPSKVPEQKKIASILSTYDDLIKNNRRRIQLLEESARLFYREWFVRLRFPSHEHVKIIDGVPEGWEKKKIAEVTDTYGGGTPSTKISEYWVGGNIMWFIPKDLTNNDCLVLLDSEKKITEEGLKKSSAKMLPPEAILMTSRASIGYFGLYDGAACTNQGFISIVPRKDFLKLYLLHNLMGRKEEILLRAGGATYKEINKTTFRNMSLVIPPDHLLKQFDSFAYDVVKQVRILKKQDAALKQARDLLLPRLMNGEIAV